ncbi:hypothetical protein [Natronorubrum daqingense]|uniref:Uncharacterized protein n=1 Tax=Natronorubrum daqingense TaxID=588898 RepID=A0A1N6ZRQ4_9EURY|nr:hypothetical protein [Natronorubrum daqingense]APX95271.1 hypothetical protein BB347_00860 [Natronorubrum daqingense]SIR29550.1 hypothetical protein SAMN05421809_0892 [Natronorubrum daqingense]
MFARLTQYKHEEVQFDDNRTTGESQTEDSVNPDAEDYFGTEMDELGVETWETVEYEDDPIQRRSITVDGVTAISVSQESIDADEQDLPGRPIQLHVGAGTTTLEHAEIVEVQDETP